MSNLFESGLKLYDKLYYPSPFLYKQEVAQIIQFFPPEVKTVLDVGCGTGKHAAELCKLGFEVDAIDISNAAVKATKEELSKYDSLVVKSNIMNYSSEKKYDAVISLFQVLSYILNPLDFKNALNNIYYTLKPGGVFIFDVVNGFHIENNFEPIFSKRIKNLEIIWERERDKRKKILKGNMTVKKNGKIIFKDTQFFRYYLSDNLKKHLTKSKFSKIQIYSNFKKNKDLNIKRSSLCVICKK